VHHSHIDRFAHGASAIHGLDARAKLLAVLAYSAALISFNRYALVELAPLAVFPPAMLWLGGVPVGFALRRAVILSPFLLAVCLAGPLYDHSLHLVAFGPWQWAIGGGWLSAIDIAVKFTLGVMALTALTGTTPFSALLEGMRRLGAPRTLVMQLGVLYRYLFVLLDEGMRLRRGRDFRGAALAPAGRRLAAVGGIVGSLFVRTLERSDRIHLAMAARGYRGQAHALNAPRFRLADGAFLAGMAGYLAAARWLYPLVLWRQT
jgi:cobalt/nickel transport system permease protein